MTGLLKDVLKRDGMQKSPKWGFYMFTPFLAAKYLAGVEPAYSSKNPGFSDQCVYQFRHRMNNLNPC